MPTKDAPARDSTDGRTPSIDARTGLDKLATYPFQIATWVDDAGYPVSVAVEARIDPTGLTATFDAPAGLDVPTVPTDRSDLPDRLAHPTAAGLRLRRATARHGLGTGQPVRRRADAVGAPGLGLG